MAKSIKTASLIQQLSEAKTNAERGAILSKENSRIVSSEKRQLESQTTYGGFWWSLGKIISEEMIARELKKLPKPILTELKIQGISPQRRSDAKIFFENYETLKPLVKRFTSISALLKMVKKQSKIAETVSKETAKTDSKESAKSDVGSSNNEVVNVGTFQVPSVKEMAEKMLLEAIENGLESQDDLLALNEEFAKQIKALA